MKKTVNKVIKKISKAAIIVCVLLATPALSQLNTNCPSPAKSETIDPEDQYTPTSCAGLIQDCAPLSVEAPLEVNIYVWIMAPVSNSTSAAWTYSASPTTYTTIKACIDGANDTFSTMSVPNLTVAGVSNSYTDTKIKLVLKGYSYINDDYGYYDITNYIDYTSNYDPNAINVYLGTWTFVATYTVPNAPSYTVIESHEQFGTPTSLVGTGLPWNSVNKIYGTPSFFKSTSPVLHDNFAMYGGTLAHEVGHVLGLNHTTCVRTNSLNVIKDTIFTNVKSPLTGCCEYSHVHDAYFEMANITTTACTSDNLMSQDAGCNRYLSPQQMGVIQFNLRSRISNLLTASSYTAALNRNPTLDYSVTTNETWDNSNRYFKGNITVKTNKTLIIKCGVFMTQYSKIIVEKGAQLIIDGGHVTNIGGKLWDGIFLIGSAGQAQLTPNSSNPGSLLHQGILRIKNGGTISQAAIGVRSYGPGGGSTCGGVILAQNANFYNNVIDVSMNHPFTANSIPIPSASWFYNCNFITNDTIGTFNGSYYAPNRHVELFRVSGVKFRGCVFKYDSPVSGIPHGTGIYSHDANYTVDKNLNDSCLFQSLDNGIYVNNVNPLKIPSISNSIFVDNITYAAYFMNAYNFYFTGNRVRASSYGEGVYLNQCKYYKIHNNRFTEHIGNMAPGINVYRSKTGAHEIYKNDFAKLLVGINCMDYNGNATNPADGLKMNCNRFHLGTPNMYDVALSFTTGLANARVNKTQGNIGVSPPANSLVRNIYGATCASNQNKWQIHSGNTYVIDHGTNTNSLSAVTQPTASGCKSSFLNVQDKGISLDYPIDCPVNPLSSGGTSTNTSQRLSDMNTYLSTICSNTATNFFEIQSTVAGRLNTFLTDSLDLYADSVITILESNQGLMEDADIQTVFAYMRKGDYTTAQTKADNMSSTKADWSAYLLKLIDLEKDTVNGIYGLNSNGTNRTFILDYATTDNKDAQASAQALMLEACDTLYSEPHALPAGTGGSRLLYQENEIASLRGDQNDLISIYPNPAESGLTLSYTSENTESVTIELRDLVGRLIYTKFSNRERSNTYYIPMENISPGMYLINITRNKEVIFKEKVIKN